MFNPFSIGATAVAWANYKKAKQAYEAACKEDDTTAILAAVSQYEDTKYNQLDQYDKDEYVPHENADFLFVPVVNCGMMVGNKCRCLYQFTIKNLSNYDYEMRRFDISLKLYGKEIFSKTNMRGELKAGSSMTLGYLPGHAGSGVVYNWNDFEGLIRRSLNDMEIMTDEFKKAREAVRTANQRGTYTPPISSCEVPTVIVGNPPVVSADVFFEYRSNKPGESTDVGAASYKDIKGSFVYRGEAYYPANGGK